MNLIRFLLTSSWITLTLAIVAGLISGGCNAGIIALINQVLGQNNTFTSAIAWSFASLCLLQFLMNLSAEALLIRNSQDAVCKLRLYLSKRILASPLRQIEVTGIPRLLASLTDDIQAISDSILRIPFFCVNLATLIGCIIYLGTLSWTALAWTLGFLTLGIISYQIPTNQGIMLLEDARDSQDRLFGHFRAITEGIKELKLNRARHLAFINEELQPTVTACRDNQITGLTILSAAATWGDLLAFSLIGLALFVLAPLQQINNLVLASFVLTGIYLVGPLANCVEILPSLATASIALKKIENLGLSLSKSELKSSVVIKPVDSLRSLELRGVTHAYYREQESSYFTLGAIDLTFKPRELVFIVGGNGSGKSTLVKLLTGLYIPESGEIRLNNQVITNENREWYRQHFSVVFSDFYLFDRILGFSSPDQDLSIQDYLVKLQLDHKVEINDGKLSTTALSQGQRKRLALLAAYLEDRPIYIFDEWASDQDPTFKDVFYTQLLPELQSQGKTVIVVSHDDHYFPLAERIIKLADGQVESNQRVAIKDAV
ncbi:MAG: cyclic peptide export ABC transporter [Xenococcaceae cyanobacterium MO_207.B15]|nr:cyclic peptide export ABC transporter [Xenococcaceae cyanobacterium MO_207.B15]